MALKISTGLRNHMLDSGSFKAGMDGSFIDIYSGVEPLTADAAINSQGANTLLCRISLDATASGVNFAASASAGVILKASAETWRGVNQANGTAAFYRLVNSADDGTNSTTQKRVQGSVGTFGAEMNLSSLTFTASASQNISHFSISLPTL